MQQWFHTIVTEGIIVQSLKTKTSREVYTIIVLPLGQYTLYS